MGSPLGGVTGNQQGAMVEQFGEFLGRVALREQIFGDGLGLGLLDLRVPPLGQLLLQRGGLTLAPVLVRLLLLRRHAVGKLLAFGDGLLVGGVAFLKLCVGCDPLRGVGLRQLGKLGLISDKLRLQAAQNNVQMVGVMSTLRLYLFQHCLRLALGFCGLCRLAPVIGVLHVPGFQFRLLELDLAKVDFRVFVFRFLRLYGRFLALLRLGCRNGLLCLVSAFLCALLRFLRDLLPALGQEVHR